MESNNSSSSNYNNNKHNKRRMKKFLIKNQTFLLLKVSGFSLFEKWSSAEEGIENFCGDTEKKIVPLEKMKKGEEVEEEKRFCWEKFHATTKVKQKTRKSFPIFTHKKEFMLFLYFLIQFQFSILDQNHSSPYTPTFDFERTS